MIRKSVDVIREAAAEQRGYADQCIHAPKAKTKFLENAVRGAIPGFGERVAARVKAGS